MVRTGKGRTATKKQAAQKPIEQYEHKDKKRANIPPVGLVTPETDPVEPAKGAGRKTYQYDPHLDPQLQFDSKTVRETVSRAIAEGLAPEEKPEAPEDAAAKVARLTRELERARASLQALDKLQSPYLNWAGKAERTSFEIPTVSLHVHERIDPRTIMEAVKAKNADGRKDEQMPLFGRPEENRPLREEFPFYGHNLGWKNRLIAGDSLLVMNSLLEKEGLGGQVQMVYIDPPYGIRYGSNFQPFVNKRDVKDGSDDDLTLEPETLKAFRDTWELGIHSYLTYLRDRLLLTKALLHESGSCFVQISDENIHYVRKLLDEVFGPTNFVAQIAFTTTTSEKTNRIAGICDYILWYAKASEHLRFNPIYTRKELGGEGGSKYRLVRLADGSDVSISEFEDSRKPLPAGARVFYPDTITSQRPGGRYTVHFENEEFRPDPGYWKPSEDGFKKLIAARRIRREGERRLRYVRFFDDFPYYRITNVWNDMSGVQSRADSKVYSVQTPTRVIERCVLMATHPGDLVLDPTCGSGTTAYVAEQWGRRWITTDTSRVAVTLAKQRLMTATFDYYVLAHPKQGVGSGFRYKTVPHVMLSSIANNPDIREGMSAEQIDKAIAKYADTETLYDQPEVDNKTARVTGPFTVEAVPAAAFGQPEVRQIDRIDSEDQKPLPGMEDPTYLQPDASISRQGQTLRQSEWRSELLKTGIRGKNKATLEFVRVDPLPGTRWLSADAETKEDKPQRAVISFGHEHAPLEQRQVTHALEEAQTLFPRPKLVIFAALQFDPEASKDIDEAKFPGVQLLKAQMNGDLVTEDLKKKRSSNESFWLVGQPDVQVEAIAKGKHKGNYRVEVHGFDYYNPKSGKVESGGRSNIAMWMLDTDYDGRSVYPRQVFFPMAGPKDGWARLAKNLKAEIDPDLIEQYCGTVSLPFEKGKHGRVAVKIVDDRGIESLRIVPLP